MRVRFRAPLAANSRMENLFECAFFSRVFKDYGAKFLSIQVPINQKNLGSKLATNFVLNFWVKIDKPMCGLIGVEKSGIRNNLAQTFAKAGLACGNSASDPDDSHSSQVYLRHGSACPCQSPRCDPFGKVDVKRLLHFQCAER